MLNLFPLYIRHVSLAALVLCANLLAQGQGCADAILLCSGFSTDTLDSSTGLPADLPSSYCFSDAPNAYFFQFNTLNTTLYPGIAYTDSSATLFFLVDSCRTDSQYALGGLNIAIFTAADPCDSDGYSAPLLCETGVSSAVQVNMSGLQPATTYYVVVSGADGPPPAEFPSSCAFRMGVSGPAVTYNLNPQPLNQTIFPGETATMNVDPQFTPYQWQGEALQAGSGAQASANPTSFGVYNYTATTEIENCEFVSNMRVTVVPPIVPYNTFTPNNDGFNDTWVIDRIQEWPNAQIVVYSRWGAKVFQTTNYRNNWDGDGLPAATYYYVIELNPIDFQTDPITGSVTILR
jgi:gliding motility-associated-like protein